MQDIFPTIDDYIQLKEEIEKSKGFDKVKPALSFQQEFFGLFGTAVFMKTGANNYHTVACTNIPNCTPDSKKEDNSENPEDNTEDSFDESFTAFDYNTAFESDEGGEDADDFFDKLEDEVDFGENSKEEFKQLSDSLISKLAPCFSLEKNPRFFTDFNSMTEFVPMNVAACFQGYKLLVIPIRKPASYKRAASKNADAIVICYTYDDSPYLKEESVDYIERIWNMYYSLSCKRSNTIEY